ncbi:MAG: ECF transporter S component [Caldisericaceae bacterium]
MSWTNNSSKRLRNIIYAGILAALSFVLMRFIEFPLIPSVPFLKTDLGDIPLLLGAIQLGPIYGIAIALIKNLLFFATGAGGGGPIGVLVNFIAVATFAFVTGLLTIKKKSISTIAIGLLLGGISMVAVMVPVNFWAVPLFMPGITQEALVEYIYKVNIPFNLVKAALDVVLVSFLSLALLKRNFLN